MSVRAWLIPAVIGVFGLMAPAEASANGVFFSEYVEGSGNNRALEIFNATGATVDLSDYSVLLYLNGSGIPSATITLSGSLPGGGSFVLAHTSADAGIDADQRSSSLNFTGDDAIELRQSSTAIDVIGQIGFDPGTSWGSGGTVTADATLRRKPQVTTGDPVGTDAFVPADQWLGFATDTFDGLGTHALAVGPPTITGTQPVSPANNNDPLIRGTLGAGAPTTVRIYTNATCSGAPAVTGTPADFAGAGVVLHVADDSSTPVTALVTDGSTDSLCSNSVTYVEDSTAPETTITSAPAPITDDPTPTFAFSSAEALSSFECRVDAAAFSPCSGPGGQHTTEPLMDGPHTFEVRATDRAGNLDASPAAATFTINTAPADTDPPDTDQPDTAAPETTITKGPAKKITKRKVTFTFASSEAPAAFECKLDKAEFAACVSGLRIKVKPGRHTFEVRAKDGAGNVDQTPARVRFKVKHR